MSASSFLIDPRGDLYQCWDDVGDPSQSVGTLSDGPGTLSPRRVEWLGYELDDPDCRKCPILPVCMGGCPNGYRKKHRRFCHAMKYHAKEYLLLLSYIGVFLVLSLLSLLGGYASNRLYIVLQTQTAYQMTQDLLGHLRRLPLSYFYKKDAAHLTQQVGNDANTLTMYYLSLFTTAIMDVFTLAAILVLVFWFHAWIGAALLLTVVLCLLAYLMTSRRLYGAMYDLSEAQNRYFSAMNEQLFRVKFIRLHALEKTYSHALKNQFFSVFRSAKKNQSASYHVTGIDTLLQLLSQSFLFLYGGLAVWGGRLSVGLLTAFLSYYRSALTHLHSLLGFGKARQNARGSFDRTKAILEEDTQENGARRPGGIRRIDVENLTFSYGGKPILEKKNFTFSVARSMASLERTAPASPR